MGNHQTYAPDLAVLIHKVLTERGILIRGLAHPLVFSQVSQTLNSNPKL